MSWELQGCCCPLAVYTATLVAARATVTRNLSIQEDEGQSWLQPPLTSLELDGLLCALQLARPELREVLLELADPR